MARRAGAAVALKQKLSRREAFSRISTGIYSLNAYLALAVSESDKVARKGEGRARAISYRSASARPASISGKIGSNKIIHK